MTVCKCLNCGKTFNKTPSAIKNGRGKYCSKKCMNKGLSVRYKGREGMTHLYGKNNPNWRGISLPKECPICGEIYNPSKKTQKTCSYECGLKFRANNIRGKNNPFYKKHPPQGKVCAYCGSIFYKNGSKGCGKYYCSEECSIRGMKTSIPQTYLYDELEKNGYSVEMEKTWDWLKSPISDQNLKVDIYLIDENIAIEYDGRHHFEIGVFNNTEDDLHNIQLRDKQKNKLLKEHNIPLLRYEGKINMNDILRDIQCLK